MDTIPLNFARGKYYGGDENEDNRNNSKNGYCSRCSAT